MLLKPTLSFIATVGLKTKPNKTRPLLDATNSEYFLASLHFLPTFWVTTIMWMDVSQPAAAI